MPKKQSMSLLGAKRTRAGALQMSAFDPKRTLSSTHAGFPDAGPVLLHLLRQNRRTYGNFLGTTCQNAHLGIAGMGTGDMSVRDEYLLRAAHLLARAGAEANAALKKEFENVARSYLRLADQAERNAQNDIVYETPPPPKDRDQA